ncbi:cation transporter [Vibrio gallicus]|uniref:cation transporter n=1 Tax=Vibrio gallicus TaxID=190897 RepID=UPI0021C44154|nr:cation transporter [Vibrio gallicus]
MNKDSFGICLSRTMLKGNEHTTFTHVRAYQASDSEIGPKVLLAIPQMSGKELLDTMQHSCNLIWRASYFCRAEHE